MEIIKLKLDTDELLDSFQLSRNKSCTLLDNWLSDKFLDTVAPSILEKLEDHRLHLLQEGDLWNEEELKMQFLAFVFYYANINEVRKIKMFYERSLTATINGYKLAVKCDCLLAMPKGIGTPANPYFFLQEFKKQKQEQDAEGQMLAAMLIAQHTNNNGKPVYGAYLQGKFWTFTTLHGTNYCLSKAYDATITEDLGRIMAILNRLKHLILTELID